ncbi:MAG: Uma2 family endonuclease [Cyanobacteria bacterium P01_G01_bin.67]
MTSVTLSLKPFVNRIDETDLENLCQANPDARLEIDPEGKLIVMSPTGCESGKRNTSLIF